MTRAFADKIGADGFTPDAGSPANLQKQCKIKKYVILLLMEKTDKSSISVQPDYSEPDSKGRVTIPIDLRFSDMDANGHLFFGNYFTLFDTAFLEYLKVIGFSFDMFCQNQLNFYYVEANSRYKAPVKYGDELSIRVWVENFGCTSFTIKFEAFNKTNDKVAATGLIVAVVVNKETEKPTPLPEKFKKAIENKP